jgi:hypothetical protein
VNASTRLRRFDHVPDYQPYSLQDAPPTTADFVRVERHRNLAIGRGGTGQGLRSPFRRPLCRGAGGHSSPTTVTMKLTTAHTNDARVPGGCHA